MGACINTTKTKPLELITLIKLLFFCRSSHLLCKYTQLSVWALTSGLHGCAYKRFEFFIWFVFYGYFFTYSLSAFEMSTHWNKYQNRTDFNTTTVSLTKNRFRYSKVFWTKKYSVEVSFYPASSLQGKTHFCLLWEYHYMVTCSCMNENDNACWKMPTKKRMEKRQTNSQKGYSRK